MVNFEEYTECQKVDEPDLKSELSRRDVVAIMIRLEFFERETFAGHKELNHVRSVQTNQSEEELDSELSTLPREPVGNRSCSFLLRSHLETRRTVETFDGIVPGPETFR